MVTLLPKRTCESIAHQHARKGKPMVPNRLHQGLLRDHSAQDRQPHHRPAHDRRRRLHAQVRHPGQSRRRPRLHLSGSPTRKSPDGAKSTSHTSRWSEATLALPLIVSYTFRKKARNRPDGKSGPPSSIRSPSPCNLHKLPKEAVIAAQNGGPFVTSGLPAVTPTLLLPLTLPLRVIAA